MNITDHLISCDDDIAISSSKEMVFFSLQDTSSLWSTEALLCNDFLEKLVFQISKKPKRLIAHVQRIYYCFQMQLDDQLFAALIDFLVILNKQGSAISWRMVNGAKSRLSEQQFDLLNDYLNNSNAQAHQLPGNQFSIFTRGLSGSDQLISQTAKADTPINEHDPLVIARDHIEYSQLDEAKQVLEKAILEQPTRLDLHYELLTIYQSMRDTGGFNSMLAKLTQSGVAIPDEWEHLSGYFEGLDTHE